MRKVGYTRAATENLIARMPPSLSVTELRASRLTDEFPDREDALINQINWGTHLVFGLGTFGAPTNLLDFVHVNSFDPARLARNHRYQFFLAMTCKQGTSWYAPLPSTALALMRVPNAGAIGWCGPTGDSFQSENYAIERRVVDRLATTSGASFAAICAEALRDYSDDHVSSRICSYRYFGDPTLVMSWDTSTPTDAHSAPAAMITELRRCLPNPFNPSTRLSISLARRSSVILRVFDVRGRLVDEIMNGTLDAGVHDFVWNPNRSKSHGVRSGTYIVRFDADGVHMSQKLTIVK